MTPNWQPIATAPRDGRKVMLAIASDPDAIETGVWAADAGRWEIARTAHGPLFLAVEPTHWADLVERPSA